MNARRNLEETTTKKIEKDWIEIDTDPDENEIVIVAFGLEDG